MDDPGFNLWLFIVALPTLIMVTVFVITKLIAETTIPAIARGSVAAVAMEAGYAPPTPDHRMTPTPLRVPVGRSSALLNDSRTDRHYNVSPRRPGAIDTMATMRCKDEDDWESDHGSMPSLEDILSAVAAVDDQGEPREECLYDYESMPELEPLDYDEDSGNDEMSRASSMPSIDMIDGHRPMRSSRLMGLTCQPEPDVGFMKIANSEDTGTSEEEDHVTFPGVEATPAAPVPDDIADWLRAPLGTTQSPVVDGSPEWLDNDKFFSSPPPRPTEDKAPAAPERPTGTIQDE